MRHLLLSVHTLTAIVFIGESAPSVRAPGRTGAVAPEYYESERTIFPEPVTSSASDSWWSAVRNCRTTGC